MNLNYATRTKYNKENENAKKNFNNSKIKINKKHTVYS